MSDSAIITPAPRGRAWVGAAVAAVTVLVFAPTLVFGFVQYDDHWLWSDTSPLRALDAAMLRDVFFELDARARRPLGGEYLPIRDVAVALDMAVWGASERGPHVSQLALYALSVWALGTLLVRWGLRFDIAWIGALVWAVHPLHVETVAWVSERKGILAGLFVFACGHAWIRYRRGGRTAWLVLAALAAVAGTWSKAPAMFAPAVFATWDLLVLPAARRRWIAIALVGAATLAAAVPVVVVARDARVVTAEAAHQPPRVAGMIGAQGHYVQGLVLARTPSIAYPIQIEGPTELDLVIGGATIAGSIAAAMLGWRRRARWALALLAWAWIWFVPVSHLVVRVHILVADRFAYLWSVAACVGAGWLLARLPRTLRLACTGGVVLVLAIASIRAQQAWTSSLELFTRALDASPRSPIACENLALAQMGDARPDRAIATLDRCLATQPGHGYLLQRKARILWALHRRDAALEVARDATASGFSSASALYAEYLHALGRHGEALPWVERAAQRQPTIEAYARLRATILFELGRADEAAAVARALVARPEAAPLGHLLLAQALGALGRAAEAEPHLAAAARAPALASRVAAIRARLVGTAH